MPHFMSVFITIYQFIKPFLDKKMSIVEEHVAFKTVICSKRGYLKNM